MKDGKKKEKKSFELWDHFWEGWHVLGNTTAPPRLSFGGWCVRRLTTANPLLIVSLCGWKAQSSAWHDRAHPDLGSHRNTLNQLGPSEGAFCSVFHLIQRGNGWSPRMADGAKDHNNTMHDNNTGVFTTRVNKNTRLMPGTPMGKVTEWRGILFQKKFANAIHVWTPEQKRNNSKRYISPSYISKVALYLETRGLSFVLMSPFVFYKTGLRPPRQRSVLCPRVTKHNDQSQSATSIEMF